MKIRRTIQKVLIALTGFLLAFMLTLTNIAYDNYATVTGFLGQQTVIQYEPEPEDGVEPQTEYFESQYKNIREVFYGGYQIQIEEQLEGTVLLKNDNNALPLAKGTKVSLFGNAHNSPFLGASGSGGINTSESISWIQAFQGRYYDAENGRTAQTAAEPYLVHNATLVSNYGGTSASSGQTNVRIGDTTWSQLQTRNGFSLIANDYDTAIMIIKRTGGEGYDLPQTTATTSTRYSMDPTSVTTSDGANGGDYLQLNDNEVSILKGLKQMKDAGQVKKVILILNMASPIQLNFLNDASYGVDACLWTGSVGEFGTVAVTKLLVGEENFSGGASMTLWADNLNNPVMSNYADNNYYFQYENYEEFGFRQMTAGYQSTFTSYMVYQEGMYLGYKYTETRYEDYVMGVQKVGNYNYDEVVAYPFGYGMSYTTFEFSNYKVTKNGRMYEVSVDVKNTGSKPGKTPVQMYIAKPYGTYERANQIQVPSVQLIDFGKTDMIQPNGTDTVKINVDEKYFASYDTFGEGTYVIPAGDYRLIVAANAHDAVNNLLAAKGYTPTSTSGRMDAAGNASLVATFNYRALNKDYAYSTETGRLITNAFDFADINTYEGRGTNEVTYYSRDDWQGTAKLSTRDANGRLTKPYAELTMTQTMADELRDQMDADKVIEKGGEYPTFGADNGLKLINFMSINDETGEIRYASYDDPRWDDLLDQLTWTDMTTLLSNGRHQTAPLAGIGKPGTGDENGPNGQSHTYGNRKTTASGFNGPKNPYGMRIGDPDAGGSFSSTGFSSNGVLASTFNKEIAAKVGKQIGEEGLWGGTAGLLGTGLNIQRTPYAGRTAEYYSEDAMLSGLIAAPETAATESMGVHCYIKHCAMNESETARHGVQFWITEQAMRENYFRAFEIAIEEGNAFNVMTSFSRIGVWAVANSVPFAQDFLRKECGLPGIVETDAAGDMTDGAHGEAYVSRMCNVYTGATDLNEYNYGANLPDYTGGSHYWSDFAPEADGGTGEYGHFAQMMRESCKRIIYATLTSNAMCGESLNTRYIEVTPAWEGVVKGINIGLGVATGLAVLWLAADVIFTALKKKSK